MRGRVVWVMLGLLCLGAGWWLRRGGREAVRGTEPSPAASAALFPAKPVTIRAGAVSSADTLTNEDHIQYRLANTSESERGLLRNDRALLLANALIDTTRPMDDLHIPDQLKAPADNGSWLVQARGPVDGRFPGFAGGSGSPGHLLHPEQRGAGAGLAGGGGPTGDEPAGGGGGALPTVL